MTPKLPPLPHMPGENEDYQYRPPGRSIISMLSDEHLVLTELVAHLARRDTPTRELTDVATAAITRHLSAEEQYLYPTVKAVAPDGDSLSTREIGRDTQILKQLALLETVPPESEVFSRLTESIGIHLHKHRDVCAEEIFPLLRDRVSEVDLIRLGNRVEVAKEAAPTRPHPESPAEPPWNKFTEPMLGIVDKVRDVITHRTTYIEDL